MLLRMPIHTNIACIRDLRLRTRLKQMNVKRQLRFFIVSNAIFIFFQIIGFIVDE